MADFGYDVADHTDVHPRSGTLADFDALVSAAHLRDLRVVLDFVPNHTSDRHEWVHRIALVTRRSEARLVRVAGSGRRRWSAQHVGVALTLAPYEAVVLAPAGAA